MDNSKNNSATATAKNTSVQRLRVVTADEGMSPEQTAKALEKQWEDEKANAVIECGSQKRLASDMKIWDELACWKKSALGRVTDYPYAPSISEVRQYVTKFDLTEYVNSEEDYVHLDDYSAFIKAIENAPRYRLKAKLAQISGYPIPPPKAPAFPKGPISLKSRSLPDEPKKPIQQPPKLKWYDYLLLWRMLHIYKQYNEAHDAAVIKHELKFLDYQTKRERIEKYNKWLSVLQEDRERYWQTKKLSFEQDCAEVHSEWSEQKAAWEQGATQDQERYNTLLSLYEQGGSENVLNYLRPHLDAIPLPRWCPRTYELAFDEEQGILVIDFQLPYLDGLDIVKTRQLVTGDKLVPANQKEAKEITNQLPYLIVLRFLWEVPQVDTLGKVKAVCCNGYVIYDDPATGQSRQDTIMSVLVKREELLDINLSKVLPDACFTGLKGVAAARISDLVPVQPIIQFSRYEGRFIESKDVLDTVGDTNLATMDWQEFEHLIRELFAKEFGTEGAEVKITQASRDRGVDAIAFDPDPLRGGKFVIQAKRYTSTVDVSAVRDLYGTVLNEGANRGILVTTSKFGGDSHDFAKDKPLTLVDGAQLLHLLSKHGYNMKLDLKEARRLLKERTI